MPARLSAFVVWALVAASVAFWSLRLGSRAPEAPANTVLVGDSVALAGDVSRLLGAAAAPTATAAAPAPEAASRFKLTGIMAPSASSGSTAGLALIAVDGKPPRPYAVGAALDAQWVVQSLSQRSVKLGPPQGAVALTLDMPPLTAAATGSLPPPQRMAPEPVPGLLGVPSAQPQGAMVPPQPPQGGAPGASPPP
jgi:general secretion pathway protein C